MAACFISYRHRWRDTLSAACNCVLLLTAARFTLVFPYRTVLCSSCCAVLLGGDSPPATLSGTRNSGDDPATTVDTRSACVVASTTRQLPVGNVQLRSLSTPLIKGRTQRGNDRGSRQRRFQRRASARRTRYGQRSGTPPRSRPICRDPRLRGGGGGGVRSRLCERRGR